MEDFVGEKHEANESCKFHIRKQEASESKVLYRCSATTCKKKKTAINSGVREIKEEKEEPQFLSSVTLENVYAIMDDTTGWQSHHKALHLNFKFQVMYKCTHDYSLGPDLEKKISHPTNKQETSRTSSS